MSRRVVGRSAHEASAITAKPAGPSLALGRLLGVRLLAVAGHDLPQVAVRGHAGVVGEHLPWMQRQRGGAVGGLERDELALGHLDGPAKPLAVEPLGPVQVADPSVMNPTCAFIVLASSFIDRISSVTVMTDGDQRR